MVQTYHDTYQMLSNARQEGSSSIGTYHLPEPIVAHCAVPVGWFRERAVWDPGVCRLKLHFGSCCRFWDLRKSARAGCAFVVQVIDSGDFHGKHQSLYILHRRTPELEVQEVAGLSGRPVVCAMWRDKTGPIIANSRLEDDKCQSTC
jgi:hypothetical protein